MSPATDTAPGAAPAAAPEARRGCLHLAHAPRCTAPTRDDVVFSAP